MLNMTPHLTGDNWESFDKLNVLASQGRIAAQWLIDAWAWVFFAINTSLTASIMYKIMSVASFFDLLSTHVYVANYGSIGSSATRDSTMLENSHESRFIYRTVIRAVVESSLITWVVLLPYTISTTVYFSQSVSTISVSHHHQQLFDHTHPRNRHIRQAYTLSRCSRSSS
jgi:hypothetical protein